MEVMRFQKNKNEEEWNSFLLQAKSSTFLFNRNFMDYHSDRFADHSLMVYDEKKLVALLPANIYKGTLISHQGLTYGGIVTRVNTKLRHIIEIVYNVLSFCIRKVFFLLN